MSKVTKSMVEGIRSLRASGFSIVDIAEFYEISRQTVYNNIQLNMNEPLPVEYMHAPWPEGCRDEWKRRQRANGMVSIAIRKGMLTPQPCEACGCDIYGIEKGKRLRVVQAHHDDYDKPLEVRWLCRKHHAEWHKAHPNEVMVGFKTKEEEKEFKKNRMVVSKYSHPELATNIIDTTATAGKKTKKKID